MSRPAKCQLCHEREADWALQYIGSDEPMVYALGYHIRGFRVTKVCWECAERTRNEYVRAQNRVNDTADRTPCPASTVSPMD